MASRFLNIVVKMRAPVFLAGEEEISSKKLLQQLKCAHKQICHDLNSHSHIHHATPTAIASKFLYIVFEIRTQDFLPGEN
jgi:hypothetical protein